MNATLFSKHPKTLILMMIVVVAVTAGVAQSFFDSFEAGDDHSMHFGHEGEEARSETGSSAESMPGRTRSVKWTHQKRNMKHDGLSSHKFFGDHARGWHW